MPSLEELLLLWHGDGETTGYHHEEIVVAVCELRQPSSESQAYNILYSGINVDEIERDDRDIVARGYELYLRRLALPKRKHSSGVVLRVNRAMGR